MRKLLQTETVNSVAELVTVLQKIVPVGVDPFTVFTVNKNDNEVLIRLFEKTLSDGSVVYDVEFL